MIYLKLVFLAFTLTSCQYFALQGDVDPQNIYYIPDDKGGTHQAVLASESTAPYGHYVYLPSTYNKTPLMEYPLLLFLHGSGEKGDSSTLAILDDVLVNGPPKLIENGSWDPPISMIVVSPQLNSGSWGPTITQEMIDYLKSTYRINQDHIYLTGLSLGGMGTFGYLTQYGDQGDVAAAVPICGSGNDSKVDQCLEIPIWAFHGDADTTVEPTGSTDFVTAYNSQIPAPEVEALVTIYPEVGHNSWARTYDGFGMGTEDSNYDPFDMSIYTWMLQYSR